MNKTINVKYIKNDNKTIDNKYLKWPQNYEDFIADIIRNFNLNSGKPNIILKLITEDNDTFDISSQEELEPYLSGNDIKEFKFFLEEEKVINNLDDDFDLEKVFENQIKIDEINIDNIFKDIFDEQGYAEKINTEKNKFKETFRKNLELNINDIINKKQKDIENEINLKLSSLSNSFTKEQKNMKNIMYDIKDDIVKIKDETFDMSLAIKDLCEIIQKMQNHIDMLENKGKLNIKLDKERIDKIIDIKDTKFFNIDDIKIKNIGNFSYRNLCFIIDENNSSNEIRFFGNSKYDKKHDFTMNGEFKKNDMQNVTISLNIKNPQPEKTYTLILYIREKGKEENLSKPLTILVKINKFEDPIQKKQIIAKQIYEELIKEFPNYYNLINKEEIFNRVINNNFNIEEYKKSINEQIKKIEKKQINEKAEQIYNQLDFKNFDIDKNEIIALIIELKFDKEKIQNIINEKIKKNEIEKAEIIYEKLSQLEDIDISKYNKNEVIGKIIEVNFNIEKLRDIYRKEIKKVDERADKIYKEVDEEYGVSSFMDEQVVKAKIKELNYNKELICQWIEEQLFNN